MTAKELREKRAALAKEIQQLREAFNKESKWADAAQEERWKKVNADYDALTRQIEIVERADAIAKDQESPADRRDNTPPGRDNADGGENRNTPPAVNEERRARALAAWMRHQQGGSLTDEDVEACREARINLNARELEIPLGNTQSRRQLQRTFRSVHPTRAMEACLESRSAMSAQLAGAGGALIPETFIRNLELNMLAFGGMRQVSELLTTSTGERMMWPTADDTSNTGEQVGENSNIDNSGAGGPNPSFTRIFWDAYKFSSKMILVPFELLQDSFVDLPAVLGQMIGERLGRITNTKFTTGNGAGTCKGIVTAASSGVTAASATAITYDEVIRLEHSIDPAYRIGAGYMCHDSIVLALRLLKDGQGRYIWQDNANSGTPPTLNGRPYTVNQDMASSMASGAKTLLFGQLSKYKIRTVGSLRLYRLVERYRDQDQDGFIGLIREDGNLLTAGTAPVKYLAHP